MKTTSEILPNDKRKDITSGIIRRFIQIAAVIAVQAALLFLAAGRLDWTWAWVFLGISVVSILINGTLLLRTNREAVAERGRPKEMKGWDKIVSGLYSLSQYLVLPVVAGLDTRFGWTGEIGIVWFIGGALAYALALGLSTWAMVVNAYFSTVVRIQTERGHTVCRSGPYRFVRHPGYVAFILQAITTAILLGSGWALIPAIGSAATVIIRTSLEDRILRAELPGYADYAQEVRYRLVPGVW
jgi:protein-S-isoprenylcysteine O-methyltransferase Ste14